MGSVKGKIDTVGNQTIKAENKGKTFSQNSKEKKNIKIMEVKICSKENGNSITLIDCF